MSRLVVLLLLVVAVCAVAGFKLESRHQSLVSFDSDIDADVDVDVDVDAGAEAVTEVEAEAENGVDVDAEVESESEVDADSTMVKTAPKKPAAKSPIAKPAAKTTAKTATKTTAKTTTATKPVRQVLKEKTYANINDEFDQFLTAHKKKYSKKSNAPKYNTRLKTYTANREIVRKQNALFKAGKIRWTMRLTAHADKNNADMAAHTMNLAGLARIFARGKSTKSTGGKPTKSAPAVKRVVAKKARFMAKKSNVVINQQPKYGGASSGGASSGGASSGGASSGGASSGGASSGGASSGGASSGGASSGGASSGGSSTSDSTTRPADDSVIDWTKYDTFDWRKIGTYFGPVQSQGADGACWVFAPVAVMEFHYAKKSGHFVKFNETALMNQVTNAFMNVNTTSILQGIGNTVQDGLQNGPVAFFKHAWAGVNKLVDSALLSHNTGPAALMTAVSSNTRGGYATLSFQYVADNSITGNDNQQYHPIASSNLFSNSSSVYSVGVSTVDQFKSSLQSMGPAVINIDAANMHLFSNGVFASVSAGADGSLPSGNHFVTAVGYGSYNGTEYIIFRNSWGDNWGDGGYGRIRVSDFDLQAVLFAKPPS